MTVESPACHHVFSENVHRWVDEMSKAVAREATVAHTDDSPVREPVESPQDDVTRGEIGVR